MGIIDSLLVSMISSMLLGLGIAVVVVMVICNYLANKISEKIKYDYLAQRIAEEICKRMMIIENQRKAAYKAATGSAEEQSRGGRDGAPEQTENRQE